MLVEFTRTRTRSVEPTYSEDYDIEVTAPAAATPDVELKIKINPVHVAAVFASTHDGNVILRLSDGRGFSVKGTYDEVTNKLEASGRTESETE